MILIFGGAYQGKLDYALKRWAVTEAEVFYCSDEDTTMPGDKKIVYEIDRWILALVRNQIDVAGKIKDFIAENKDVIVICNDISCGIVPLGEDMRAWREETGRGMAVLAQQSNEVVRLFCGIPIIIGTNYQGTV